MDRTELARPSHLPDEQWAAIDACRVRLWSALETDDRPAALGSAKELVESVARSVLHITGNTLGSGTSYAQVVSTAHRILGMHPGAMTNPDIRPIAQSAQTIATTLGAIRNAAGTGHGRATIPPVELETLNISVDSALLWSRWALAVLAPLLYGAASTVIQAVHSAIGQVTLKGHLEAANLPEQSIEDQRAIGVAFGQEAGGGFGNAWAVGVTPAVNDTRLGYWTKAYRLGLVEGLIINVLGEIQLVDQYAQDLVALAAPVDAETLTMALSEVADKVRHSVWSTTWRGATLDAAAAVAALHMAVRTSRNTGAFNELVSALEEPQLN